MEKLILPVGYLEFHSDSVINFQLNRWYSTGIFSEEEINKVASKISNFLDWKEQMSLMGKKAEKEIQYLKAATAYRAAELFTKENDKDKRFFYDKCMELFELAFMNDQVDKSYIDYSGGKLYAIRMKPDESKKGTILLHGGYDSFIEEFYNIMKIMVMEGYEVIMFEGPGQGKPLNDYNLKMDYQWEKPVSKVLDYYNLNDVTLIGISQGGYLAARAAAFEKRIKRVVLYDIIYDFYDAVMSKKKPVEKLITELLMRLKAKKLINGMEEKVRKHSLFADWLISQGFYVFGVETLFDYMLELKKYSTKNISSLIDQDVLLLAGEDDIYTIFWKKQKDALINAKSVNGRIFTREEDASHHCQVGNIGLAVNYILDWLNGKNLSS